MSRSRPRSPASRSAPAPRSTISRWRRDTGRLPVFALSPSQGDVDILIAAELMEAGRAIIRGFVTPERTTLIASSHRIAAVSEKIEPGDGRASSEKVHATAEAAAKRFIAFDMEKIAADNGSMISASLLGALAGSDALPFTRESYEQAIGAGGRGVKASLAAFGAALDRARGTARAGAKGGRAGDCRRPARRGGWRRSSGPQSLLQGWQALGRPRRRDCPSRCATWRSARPEKGRRLPGHRLWRRISRPAGQGASRWTVPDHGYALSIAAAKHLANAMCYDDMIRVADLKTRSTRDRRVRREVGVKDGSVLQVTEYFHPRIEEFCGTLPAGLGSYIENRPKLAAFLDRRINRGRRIRTDSFAGFAMLWFIGGLRRWRRSLLRHKVEVGASRSLVRAGARPRAGRTTRWPSKSSTAAG